MEPARVLEVAQAGRVRRADVDGEVVGNVGDGAGRGRVIVDVTVAVAADVDADDEALGQPRPRRADPVGQRLGAGVVEPHAVDRAPGRADRRVSRGRGLPCLRTRRDGAELDEPESERRPALDRDPVLVESRPEADAVAEAQPDDLHRVARRIGCPDAGREAAECRQASPDGCQQVEGRVMDRLGVEREEERPRRAVGGPAPGAHRSRGALSRRGRAGTPSPPGRPAGASRIRRRPSRRRTRAATGPGS